MTGDAGFTAVIVALSITVLFGFGALVLDVGRLYQERRVLQNAADAAALAVAQDCSTTGCGTYSSTATSYADQNSDDGASAVDGVCGTSTLPGCNPAPVVPPNVNYVKVSTSTLNSDGSTQVPFVLARIWGRTGQTVHASATVAWGAPTALTSQLPLTIGECEWDVYTNQGQSYVAMPPPLPNTEDVIYFHGPNEPITTGCPTQNASGAQVPGGFSWLTPTSGCNTISSDGWVPGSTGASPPNSCTASMLASLVGTVIYVPVFDSTNGLTGANNDYHIMMYAAFYLTGYKIVGQYKHTSLVTGQDPCSGNSDCISGFFVRAPDPSATTVGGQNGGVTAYAFLS